MPTPRRVLRPAQTSPSTPPELPEPTREELLAENRALRQDRDRVNRKADWLLSDRNHARTAVEDAHEEIERLASALEAAVREGRGTATALGVTRRSLKTTVAALALAKTRLAREPEPEEVVEVVASRVRAVRRTSRSA